MQWSDGQTDNPRVVTGLEPMTYTAVFESASLSSPEVVAPSKQNTATKFINNGQLMLARDGKIYTMMGQEL